MGELSIGEDPRPTRRKRPRWVRQLKRDPLTLVGAAITAVFLTLGALGTVVAPYPEDATSVPDGVAAFLPPSADHPFGTDRVGRDIFSRVIVGTRISLHLIVVTLVVAVSIGTMAGLVAGYFGGLVDEVVMRLTDAFLAIPPLVLAMLVATTLGGGLMNTILAVSVTWWPTYARLVRGEALRLRELAFMEAANALAARPRRIVARHILPNLVLPLVVQVSVDSGRVLLVTAALGFLGLGARSPQPEWGLMIAVGREFLPFFWWESLFPGVAIFLVVIGFSLLGDGLRSIFDPRRALH